MGNFFDCTMLSDIKVGEKFRIGKINFENIDFTVLDHISEGILCISENLSDYSKIFDNNSNNFAKSDIKRYLNSNYYKKIISLIDYDGIIEHEVDLISLDGLDMYGKTKCFVSMLTLGLYQKYRKIIKCNGLYYWMATPWFVDENHEYNNTLCGILGNGCVTEFSYDNNTGVRPVCVFKPSILVSKID